MAMSTVYTTIGGEMLSEVRGGTEMLYVPDTLGSLVQTRSVSGAKTSEAEYWPYGEVRTQTGTNPSPWGFVGLLGYLRDLTDLLYVRARHYRPGLMRWQTTDPLWPQEATYDYVSASPTAWADPSGLINPACIGCIGCIGAGAIGLLLSCYGAEDVVSCMMCRVSMNPWLQAALVLCAAVCVVCVGSWIVGLLPKIPPISSPLPVPVPTGISAFGNGGGDPCKTPRRRRNNCQEKHAECFGHRPICVRPPDDPCFYCFLECERQGSWPTRWPCDLGRWNDPGYAPPGGL